MNIKIIFTEESGRPPMYTTMANLPDQEKFFSKIIKEVVKVDETKKPSLKEVIAETEKKENDLLIKRASEIKEELKNRPILNIPIYTDESLIKELFKRGKNEKTISKFLGLEEKFVKNVLESK